MNETEKNNPANKTRTISLIGAVIAGGLASACCVGPLLVVLLGLGSASAFIAMAPYRPVFAVITFALLAWAGWQYWQGRKQCITHGCPPKRPVLFWLMGGLALLFLVSPSLLPYFIQ